MISLTRLRWQNFRSHKWAWRSLWGFGVVLITACCANLICNERPLFVSYKGRAFFPVWRYYPETAFGGELDLETDYQSADFLAALERERGFAVWPLLRYGPSTVNTQLSEPAPTAPTWENLLGTDDQGRDVLTRLIYGLRVSLLFGLSLAFLSSCLGIAAGAIQGYFGGWVDLAFQRIVEIWSGLPALFVLMILTSLIKPSIWWLLGIMVCFNWTTLVPLVRAEFLRARQLTYVKAAQVLGVRPAMIVLRHILPNVMTSALSYFPFLVSQSISTLTALDFLGVGLPPGSPSLGELLQQARTNLYAPWLGLTAFLSVAIVLLLVTFIGEGLREAFAPQSKRPPV